MRSVHQRWWYSFWSLKISYSKPAGIAAQNESHGVMRRDPDPSNALHANYSVSYGTVHHNKIIHIVMTGLRIRLKQHPVCNFQKARRGNLVGREVPIATHYPRRLQEVECNRGVSVRCK